MVIAVDSGTPMATSAVYLLHGALGAAEQLADLRARLAPRYRVHVLELEGHGATAARARPYRMAHFVENLIESLDREGVDQAHVFGYSMGGYVALVAAATHATRVASVATLGTKFRWDPALAAHEAARLDPEVISTKIPRFADALRARHVGAGGWEPVLARTADMMRDLGAHPVLDDAVLGRLSLPVRVMVGDRDATVTVEESAMVARVLPAGELEVLPRTGHPLEKVDMERLAVSLSDLYR